jgi:hypothetical protein
MQQTGPLDALPLLGVYLIISLVALLAVELGFRAARNRLMRSVHENEAPVGAIVGATLGLLAFLLAFTFGLAAGRFDARKGFILDEANGLAAKVAGSSLGRPTASHPCTVLLRLDAAQHRVNVWIISNLAVTKSWSARFAHCSPWSGHSANTV